MLFNSLESPIVIACAGAMLRLPAPSRSATVRPVILTPQMVKVKGQ
jgi:phosphoribosylcarboxyaminoimidazole (NCAIR) mutase